MGTKSIGLSTILFLIFLTLQLTGNISWPWYAVASPLLISFGLTVLVWIAFFLIFARFGNH